MHAAVNMIGRSVNFINFKIYCAGIPKILLGAGKDYDNIAWADREQIAVKHTLGRSRKEKNCLFGVLMRLFPDLAARWNVHHDQLALLAGEQNMPEIFVRRRIPYYIGTVA